MHPELAIHGQSNSGLLQPCPAIDPVYTRTPQSLAGDMSLDDQHPVEVCKLDLEVVNESYSICLEGKENICSAEEVGCSLLSLLRGHIEASYCGDFSLRRWIARHMQMLERIRQLVLSRPFMVGNLVEMALGQVVLLSLGSLLINVVSNDISNAEEKHISVFVIIVSYVPLTITTLIAWCVVNHFFIEGPDPPGALPDTILFAGDTRHCRIDIPPQETVQQTTGNLDPRDKESLDPQATRSNLDKQETGLAYAAAAAGHKRDRLLLFHDRTASASFPPRAIGISSCWTYYLELRDSIPRAQPISDDKAKTEFTACRCRSNGFRSGVACLDPMCYRGENQNHEPSGDYRRFFEVLKRTAVSHDLPTRRRFKI